MVDIGSSKPLGVLISNSSFFTWSHPFHLFVFTLCQSTLFCFCSGHVPLEAPAVGQTSPSHPPCPQPRPSVMKVAQPSWAPHQEMPNLSKYIHQNYIYCQDQQALNTDLFKGYLLREMLKNTFIYRQKKGLTETVILFLQNLPAQEQHPPATPLLSEANGVQEHPGAPPSCAVHNLLPKVINLPGTTRTVNCREVISSVGCQWDGPEWVSITCIFNSFG